MSWREAACLPISLLGVVASCRLVPPPDSTETLVRAQRRYIAFAIAATTAAVVGFPLSAAGVEGAALGRRYNDKLDSRLSASALASATRSLGYTGSASTNGRDATEAWNDTRGAAVIGYFGHANAGLFQVDEGATNNSDQFISAGRETDLVSGNANRRRWSEFLPFADVDDLRLAVLAGCYTANDDDIFGQFSDMGAQRGIDAVVGFAGLVYYPATASGTAIGETNYSGNYFWSRFSAYAKNGDTVATALSKARTDIVAKEGSAQGWGAYRIGGSVSTPGSTRIKPSTAGQAATSRPFGLEPFTLTDLTVTSSAPGTSAIGDTTERSTTEGVTFRTLKDGTLLDLHAPASTLGELALGLSKAREAAIAFARPHDRRPV